MSFDFRNLGKCDQIAFYAHDQLQADAIKALFGLQSANWVTDTVVGEVSIWPSLPAGFDRRPLASRERSKGLLQFNYDFGIEIEILTYLEGPNWHNAFTPGFAGGLPFLSHVGFHIPDEADMPITLGGEAPLIQEMFTQSHTNDYIVEKQRKYHYRIFDTRATNGVYTKLIRRIRGPNDFAATPVNDFKTKLAAAPEPTAKHAPKTTEAVLLEALDLYRSRNAIYGDGYKRFGKFAAALFPNGIELRTADDWTRIHLMMLQMIKMMRSAERFPEGGHPDSPLDLTVYAAMQASVESEG